MADPSSLVAFETLRQTMQSTWVDTNGDGKVSVDEVRAFDADGDGKLDEGEMGRLAAQLSTQTEYTNKLLSQLQSLEEASLNHQREAQSREATLRRTMEAMDQARADASMLRGRLQNANDALEQNRRGEQDTMAAAHERDRQISALQKIVDEQAHDLDRSQAEARDAQSALERMRRSHADAQNTLSETQRRSAEEQVRHLLAYFAGILRSSSRCSPRAPPPARVTAFRFPCATNTCTPTQAPHAHVPSRPVCLASSVP